MEYHLVWCPKYRKKIFERVEVWERAEQMIWEICEAYNIEVLEMEVMEEHIHLLVSFLPSWSIGEVVRIIKSNNGRGLFREFPGLKKRLWGGELWEDGYFVPTVGDRMTRDVIAKYVEHHCELEQGPAQLALKLRF
ncbi:MAG: IS200/IS605 family transposase [Candidatus Aminicenantales bacterium]